MNMPFSLLRKSMSVPTLNKPVISDFMVDVHSHILPGLDNGPTTVEESISLIRTMSAHGVRKIIATPHIMGDFYKNNLEDIQIAKNKIDRELKRRSDKVVIDIAAEYYVDVTFMGLLDGQHSFLTFGEKYILLETSLVSLPVFFWEAINKLIQQGYKPILAHPERYNYIQQNFDIANELVSRGVLLQVSLSSLIHTYKPTRITAEKLVNDGLVGFLGSNVHHLREWDGIRKALKTKTYQNAFDKGLLNNSLI